MKTATEALYRHPAFFPHRLLRKMGIRRFWAQNVILTIGVVIALTLCAWKDRSLIILNGYGYLEHPGVVGWYVIQLVMPISIYATLKAAIRSKYHYKKVVDRAKAFSFRARVFRPMLIFVGFETPISRSLFGLLFFVGLVAFAWNTLQNLSPGKLAPLDFWDSINFPFGYIGTRVQKFYLHVLLLPSIVHIFTGIVCTNINVIRFLNRRNKVRLAPFSPDKCGGFGFLADLILTPTISLLLVSGLAFLGVVYTHRTFDITTVEGIVVQAAILVVFYAVPTFLLRSILVKVKRSAQLNIELRQERLSETILSPDLRAASLRKAHGNLQYFNDISERIEKIPDWPHFAKVSRVFGVSISPALVSLLANGSIIFRRIYLNLL